MSGDGDALDVDLEAVTREMLAKIGAGHFVALAGLSGDDDHLDLLWPFPGAAWRRRRRGWRRGRRPSTPSRGRASAAPFWMKGTKITGRPDSNSTPSSTTSSASDCLPIGLADHDQIEAPADAADLVGGAGKLAFIMRVSDEMPARLAACSNRAIAARAFLSDSRALHFDEFRRNAAHDRAGDDRLVGEGDAEQMSLEGFRHRDGIIAGGITARPARD